MLSPIYGVFYVEHRDINGRDLFLFRLLLTVSFLKKLYPTKVKAVDCSPDSLA